MDTVQLQVLSLYNHLNQVKEDFSEGCKHRAKNTVFQEKSGISTKNVEWPFLMVIPVSATRWRQTRRTLKRPLRFLTLIDTTRIRCDPVDRWCAFLCFQEDRSPFRSELCDRKSGPRSGWGGVADPLKQHLAISQFSRAAFSSRARLISWWPHTHTNMCVCVCARACKQPCTYNCCA